jgi:hypothetical protein
MKAAISGVSLQREAAGIEETRLWHPVIALIGLRARRQKERIGADRCLRGQFRATKRYVMALLEVSICGSELALRGCAERGRSQIVLRNGSGLTLQSEFSSAWTFPIHLTGLHLPLGQRRPQPQQRQQHKRECLRIPGHARIPCCEVSRVRLLL